MLPHSNFGYAGAVRFRSSHPFLTRSVLNLWPPLAFAGIRVTSISRDFRQITVRLREHWWNRNVAGVHFGGSLFSMTDPFWMMLVLRQLGSDHVVWDRAAEIEFLKPGRGDVTARFVLPEHAVEQLRLLAREGAKVLEWFSVDIIDADGEVVARVRKQIYVRRKPATR